MLGDIVTRLESMAARVTLLDSKVGTFTPPPHSEGGQNPGSGSLPDLSSFVSQLLVAFKSMVQRISTIEQWMQRVVGGIAGLERRHAEDVHSLLVRCDENLALCHKLQRRMAALSERMVLKDFFGDYKPHTADSGVAEANSVPQLEVLLGTDVAGVTASETGGDPLESAPEHGSVHVASDDDGVGKGSDTIFEVVSIPDSLVVEDDAGEDMITVVGNPADGEAQAVMSAADADSRGSTEY
eukprot:69974-Amphidinium_carterae.2